MILLGGSLGDRFGRRRIFVLGTWWFALASLLCGLAPNPEVLIAAAPDEHAGIASGVNNAVARAGSLLAVAALPVAVGLGGDQYADPVAFDAAYGSAMQACAVLLVCGGALSWMAIVE
ncbi:MAG: hypothetical protein Q7J48_12510 [Nocardioides sp.]|nr:hypothetical protein [Nocardioides sp.]